MDKNGYLKEAKNLIKFARRELKKAKKENNTTLSRQVCEKGYLILLRIIDAFFVKSGVKDEDLPNGERGRRYFLRKYADKEFRTKYEALRHSLHIDGFHEGILEFKEIKESLDDLKELIKEVEDG